MTEHDDIARRLREAVETTPARDEDIDVIAANARRRRNVRWTVTAGVTTVIVAVAAVAALGLVRRYDRPDRIELANGPTAAATAGPTAAATTGPAYWQEWQSLPPSPLDPRLGAFSASTGDELLVWGGYGWGRAEGPRSDGAVYDGRRWSELPESPLRARARTNGVATWTGDELWIVGGMGGDDGRTLMRDAAAYRPATRTWRQLPSVPEPISGGAWAGDQLVVVADGSRAVYTLAADGRQWRELGALPSPSAADNSDLHVLAAGSRVAVVGLGDIFVRDLGGDREWQEVPAPGGGDGLPNVRGAVAEPQAFVVLLPDGIYRYALDGGGWSRIGDDLRVDPPQSIPLLRTNGGVLVAVDLINAWIYAMSDEREWTAQVISWLGAPRDQATVEVVGDQIVVWGGVDTKQPGMTLRSPE